MGRAENIILRDVERAIAVIYGERARLVRVQSGRFAVGDRFVRGAEAGTADLLGVVDGRAVALEVKAPKGRQSDTQREWGERWTAAGGLYAVVRSGSEAVEAVANAADRRRL
jgi:hypothetical protein